MVTNKFHRLQPTNGADPAAIVDQPTLTSPKGLIDTLSRNSGIVVASWDTGRDQGRVHALGIVQDVDKTRSVATVDWRRANFTVSPSPQGRTQWISRPYFKFDDGPVSRYRLRDHFEDAFSSDDTTVPDRNAPEAPSLPQTEASVQERITPQAIVQPQHGDRRSPQRNRVAPNGQIIATSARGTFMGNRAYGNRWLVCELEFERVLKEPRKYAKLFFLDEAVALAAGHRPCPTCRRHRYQAYLAAVQRSIEISGAPELDEALNTARTTPHATAPIRSLPDGVFITVGPDDFRLIWENALHRWTPEGYVDPITLADIEVDDVAVLTPAPSVAALRHGYRVEVHPTVANS